MRLQRQVELGYPVGGPCTYIYIDNKRVVVCQSHLFFCFTWKIKGNLSCNILRTRFSDQPVDIHKDSEVGATEAFLRASLISSARKDAGTPLRKNTRYKVVNRAPCDAETTCVQLIGAPPPQKKQFGFPQNHRQGAPLKIDTSLYRSPPISGTWNVGTCGCLSPFPSGQNLRIFAWEMRVWVKRGPSQKSGHIPTQENQEHRWASTQKRVPFKKTDEPSGVPTSRAPPSLSRRPSLPGCVQ